MRSSCWAGLVAFALACAWPAVASAGEYSTAPFNVTQHSYAFGQAPVFMPDGKHVLFGKNFREGDGMQVYRTRLDGSQLRCLTCDGPGPNDVNNVPVPRPQGDWVLYHSWRGHNIVIGSPGYGGMGTSLWVMRPDGSQQTKITETDTDHGAGEGEDDYHAYWSPDGKHVVYAHL